LVKKPGFFSGKYRYFVLASGETRFLRMLDVLATSCPIASTSGNIRIMLEGKKSNVG